jgi:hypothetical protein
MGVMVIMNVATKNQDSPETHAEPSKPGWHGVEFKRITMVLVRTSIRSECIQETDNKVHNSNKSNLHFRHLQQRWP